jgi:hypothetical protein
VSTASAVGVGLRSFYNDPRYGGDDPTLRRLVSELEPHPGDAVILNDAAYRTFFMNYYTAREPIYVMPDAPGERSEPGKLPVVVTDNPEEQAHPYTWVLLSRLARSTSRWLFVTEFNQYSPGRTRPTEHFLIRHYFLEHERQWSNTARLLIFQPVEAPPERQGPACPASVEYGAARLAGFDLPSGSTVRAGSLFPVSLVWSHQGWPADLAPFDYSVNVSLVSPEGRVVAQYAGSPLGTFGAMSRCARRRAAGRLRTAGARLRLARWQAAAHPQCARRQPARPGHHRARAYFPCLAALRLHRRTVTSEQFRIKPRPELAERGFGVR